MFHTVNLIDNFSEGFSTKLFILIIVARTLLMYNSKISNTTLTYGESY